MKECRKQNMVNKLNEITELSLINLNAVNVFFGTVHLTKGEINLDEIEGNIEIFEKIVKEIKLNLNRIKK